MSRKRWERTPTYNSWRAMKDRCNQSSHDSYQYYGQRQITYTPEWESYEGFVRDMGVKPLGMSLDRIDSEKGYGPDNCRWANITEQNRNRRNNVHVTYGNQTKVLSEWAEVTGIPYSTLHARIVHLGWTAERALTKPIQQQVELKLTYDGRTMSTADWSRETGIPNRTIRTRIKMYGWSVDAALTTPVPNN